MTTGHPRRVSMIAVLVVIVALSAFIAAWVSLARSRSRIEAWTAEHAKIVESVVNEVASGVIADLEAVAAFVEHDQPEPDEFIAFVERIEGTANAVGVAYVSVVTADQFEAHTATQQAIRGDIYEIQQLTSEGSLDPIDRAGREVFYPVELFAVGDLIRPLVMGKVPVQDLGLGLDAGYNPEWRGDITAAIAAGRPSISQFLSVEVAAIRLERLFFASVPVHDDAGAVIGLVAAAMLEPLLVQDLEGSAALDDVSWEILPAGEAPVGAAGDDATVFPLEMPGATWSLALAPTAHAKAALEGTPWWIVGVASGLLSLLGVGFLVLAVERRSERKRAAGFRQMADDKDSFLAAVSHELRTPLTAVSGIAHELRDRPGDFGPAERNEFLGTLVEQSDELAGIVEDLLIAARSDIGKVVIHHDTIDPAGEAIRAMDTAGIKVPVTGRAGPAWADAQRVRQILRNLLTNARKYGGADVRLELGTSPNWVEVAVADSGPELPLDQQVRVFESYTSAHAPDRSVESVGLGLFISRNLARAMDGDLVYDHDGEFGRFRLRLPAASIGRVNAVAASDAPCRSSAGSLQ